MNSGNIEDSLTEQQLVKMEEMAGRYSAPQVAKYLGMRKTSFYKMLKYNKTISGRYQKARLDKIGVIASIVYDAAQAKDLTAAIFYLKTRAGWSEHKDEDNEEEFDSEDVAKDSPEYIAKVKAQIEWEEEYDRKIELKKKGEF